MKRSSRQDSIKEVLGLVTEGLNAIATIGAMIWMFSRGPWPSPLSEPATFIFILTVALLISIIIGSLVTLACLIGGFTAYAAILIVQLLLAVASCAFTYLLHFCGQHFRQSRNH